DYLRARHPSVRDRIELLARLCDIVQHAHDRGVVHRDIKPQNVCVRPDGAPVLLDFGLAQMTCAPLELGESTATHVGHLVGTVRCMSPEQARAATHEVGPRSDIYSLGLLGFEMLTGQMPYDIPDDNVPAAIVAINTLPATPAGRIVPALRGAIERALAR